MAERKTVPCVASQSFVVFGPEGTSRNVDKGESLEWDPTDFERAVAGGLIKAPAAQAAQRPRS